MSNSKWDWVKYFPRIVELYKEQMSVPKILEAIQNETDGFTPSVRMLYSKLKSEGYPTDPTERAKLLRRLNIATWPSELSMANQGPSLDLPQSTSPRSRSYASGTSPQAIVQYPTTGLSTAQNETQGSMDGTTYPPWTAEPPKRPNGFRPGFCPALPENQVSESQDSSDKCNSSSAQPLLIRDWVCTDSIPNSRVLDSLTWDFGGQDSFPDLGTHYPEGIFNTPSLSKSEIYKEMPGQQTNLQYSAFNTPRPTSAQEVGPQSYYTWDLESNIEFTSLPETPSDFTHLFPSTNTNFSRPIAKDTSGGRFERLKKQRFNGHLTSKNRNSTSTSDSGYASGGNSPFNLPTEGIRAHPRSLDEFNGLYRVPCYQLHEPRPYNEVYTPQPMGRFKDVEACQHCGYSAIHNLAWSAAAGHLKLQIFLAELKLDTLYDITTVDAAGNSALHYAAAGGANLEHFNALAEMGANIYQLNTAGRLFLHCLRPRLQIPGSDSFDEHLITTFSLNLVNLVNRFQSTGAFKWPDNDGMTIMDALTLRISDAEVRAEIFQVVHDAGHEEVIPRMPIHPRNNTKKEKSDLLSLATGNDSSFTPKEGAALQGGMQFALNDQKQSRAWEILEHAATQPSYVDPETGDNVLHALSRIRYPQTSSHTKILSQIRQFTSKDMVDLNLHNREQVSPLVAFIHERPFLGIESDETGATMSKYLDALLWKDVRKHFQNKINVNMRNHEGVTALYYAAVKARPDSVRSLIEAGANVNARLVVDGQSISILQATQNTRLEAVRDKNSLKIYLFDSVISYLEHDGAVADPTPCDERRLNEHSARVMPM